MSLDRAPGGSRAGVLGLTLGAIGVVFGDIGTSPLYALKTVFALQDRAIEATPGDVYGVISMVFWSVTVVVSVKYVVFVLRADNGGEGGVMALAALARRASAGRARLGSVAVVLGVIGAALFYGDTAITPAISVLSAVEGLQIVSPGLSGVVLPVAVVILAVLFLVQRAGTHVMGRFFGPITLAWFVAIAAVAVPEIARHPAILQGLSPTYFVVFAVQHPVLAFVALGAVVLVMTGAEALYADMGHFGKKPIRLGWFAVAFPCLMLNYLGQGALVLHDPDAVADPFFSLCPGWFRVPMLILATLATVIASQAVISGAFSLTRQAIRLGLLPNLTVRQTSAREVGQIYMPAVNWALLAAVIVLTVGFGTSASLATAYGLAVTGTFIVTTVLFLVVATTVWRWPRWRVALAGVVFLALELTFLAGNVVKIHDGGWLPLLIAAVLVTAMLVWQRGRRIVLQRRTELEGPLEVFVEQMRQRQLPRVPGAAVFLHPTKQTVPLALRANVEFNRALHERVVIVSVRVLEVPYAPPERRVVVDDLGYTDDGIVHLTATFGFQEDPDIPATLAATPASVPELDFDRDTAVFVISHLTLGAADRPSLPRWQRRIYVGLAHNAINPADNFDLPPERTIVMGGHLEL